MNRRLSGRQRDSLRDQWADLRAYVALNFISLHPAFLHGMRYVARAPIRELREGDIPHLLQVYQLLEGQQVPPGYLQHFQEGLVNPDHVTLVIDDPATLLPIASGSINTLEDAGAGHLTFGLVHPAHQGRGLGSLLFYSRIALLKPGEEDFIRVQLVATQFSKHWFLKLGIEWSNDSYDEWGALLHAGFWRLQPFDLEYVKSRMASFMPAALMERVIPFSPPEYVFEEESVEHVEDSSY